MKVLTATVLFAGTLLFAAPASAQYYPSNPPPPPQYYPPPPPPPPQYYPPPPPPPTYYQPVPMEEAKTHYTIRLSGGVAFASNGYYCGYYYNFYSTTYACGAGYTAVWPDVNLDVDIWVRPTLGVSIGANVMWGSYTPSGISGVPNNTIYSTTWEPHVDFLFGMPANQQVKGRVRFGFGSTSRTRTETTERDKTCRTTPSAEPSERASVPPSFLTPRWVSALTPSSRRGG